MSVAYDQSGWDAAPPAPAVESAAMAARLRGADPRDILAEAIERHGERLALVSSFGAESAVLLHMAAAIDRGIEVLFLDTGMLFAQTLDYRKSLAERLGLTKVRDLRPSFEDLALTDPDAELWKTDTDACCAMRKVAPLDQALAGHDAWITGRKRFQAGVRLRLPVVEWAGGKRKYNPLANMTQAALDQYASLHDLPAHPLVAAGFPSIGCWPCTTPAADNEAARAGRWRGSAKSECGIHIARAHPTPPFVAADF